MTIKKRSFTIHEVIAKAEDAQNKPKKGYRKITISLNIDADLLNKLNEYYKKRVGITRNGIILESINDKLKDQV